VNDLWRALGGRPAPTAGEQPEAVASCNVSLRHSSGMLLAAGSPPRFCVAANFCSIVCLVGGVLSVACPLAALLELPLVPRTAQSVRSTHECLILPRKVTHCDCALVLSCSHPAQAACARRFCVSLSRAQRAFSHLWQTSRSTGDIRDVAPAQTHQAQRHEEGLTWARAIFLTHALCTTLQVGPRARTLCA